MKEQEKFMYRMMEIKEMFDQCRKDMQTSSQEIKQELNREIGRFISHVDMIDEKTKGLSKELSDQLDKRIDGVVGEIDHKLKTLLENETSILRNTVYKVMKDLEKTREMAKLNYGFKNYLISGLVGALLAGGITYYMIQGYGTRKVGFTKIERELIHTGTDLTLAWSYLDDKTKDAISKGVIKGKRLRRDKMTT